MSCKPDDFLTIAKDLSDSSSEEKLRTSIGRSYYAAYHKALGFIQEAEGSSTTWLGGKGGSHQKLSDSFKFHDKPALRPLSHMLTDLKTHRHLADYNLNADVCKRDAEYCLKASQRIIDKLS